ncbi:protein of unknown function [Hyphomicrobium sp. MC1]|nr:protein of unknown function [Hyphomicrobium sp. MC1]
MRSRCRDLCSRQRVGFHRRSNFRSDDDRLLYSGKVYRRAIWVGMKNADIRLAAFPYCMCRYQAWAWASV